MKWLFINQAKSPKEKGINILACTGLIIVWSILVKIFLNYLQIPFLQVPQTMGYIFFSVCIFSPLFEEMLFRYAPIMMAKAIKQEIIFPTILISSGIFGIIHNEGMYGVLQAGGAGFILSVLFIKNGYSYISSVISHILCNIIIMYILL